METTSMINIRNQEAVAQPSSLQQPDGNPTNVANRASIPALSPLKETTRPSALLTLTTIAGGLVAMATLLGFVLHGCGHVAYTTYLQAWGVQEGLFPQTSDWKVVRGYYAIILQGSELIADLPWSTLSAAFAGLAIAIFVANLPSSKSTRFPDWFARRHFLIRESIKAMFGSALVLYVAGILIAIGTLLALIPGWLGERAGKRQADQELAALALPDARPQSELWRDGELAIAGRIIASSENLVAIYDSKLGTLRVLERGGYEIRATKNEHRQEATH